MKNIILLTLVVFTTHSAIAQFYSFSHSTETYEELPNPTVISDSNWNNEDYVLTIPFAFNYFDSPQSTIYLNANGSLKFTTDQDDLMMILGADFKEWIMDSPSDISHELTGSAPNQVLKIQWRNAGFSNDPYDSSYVNFQLWLHETYNNLSIHIGESYVEDLTYFDMGRPLIGFLNYDASEAYSLSGNPTNPELLFNPTVPSTLSSMPGSGIRYTFGSNITNIAKMEAISGLNHFPNPANEAFSISYSLEKPQVVKLSLFEMNGRLVSQQIESLMEKGEHTFYIPTESLPAGMYFYMLSGADFNLNNKVIINR